VGEAVKALRLQMPDIQVTMTWEEARRVAHALGSTTVAPTESDDLTELRKLLYPLVMTAN
jgi:hypothetical protein